MPTRLKAATRKSPPFSFDVFLGALGKPEKGSKVVQHVRALFGVEPAPDLAAYLARVRAPRAKLRVGELGLWWPGYEHFLEKSWVKAVKEEFFPSSWADVLPALTGTLHIGKNGSGDHFFVEVHPERSAVFMVDPGVGLMQYLASSLTHFVQLNYVVGDVLAHCEAKETDPDELTKKDVLGSKVLKARAADIETLAGEIHLAECNAYEELVAPLSKKRFTSKPVSPVAALAKRAEWIQRVFIHGDLEKAQAKRPPPAPKSIASLAAARVQALVEAWVFAPNELPALLVAAKTDDTEIVRMSANAFATLNASTPLRW